MWVVVSKVRVPWSGVRHRSYRPAARTCRSPRWWQRRTCTCSFIGLARLNEIPPQPTFNLSCNLCKSGRRLQTRESSVWSGVSPGCPSCTHVRKQGDLVASRAFALSRKGLASGMGRLPACPSGKVAMTRGSTYCTRTMEVARGTRTFPERAPRTATGADDTMKPTDNSSSLTPFTAVERGVHLVRRNWVAAGILRRSVPIIVNLIVSRVSPGSDILRCRPHAHAPSDFCQVR